MAAPPVCDVAQVQALAQRVLVAKEADRPALIANAWGPLCAGAHVLDGQLLQLVTATPEQVLLVDLQTGVMDAWDWERTCEGGQLALSMATKLSPAEGRALLWEKCDLQRMGAFGQVEWTSGRGPIVIPLIAWLVLTEGGATSADVRPIVRSLARLPP